MPGWQGAKVARWGGVRWQTVPQASAHAWPPARPIRASLSAGVGRGGQGEGTGRRAASSLGQPRQACSGWPPTPAHHTGPSHRATTPAHHSGPSLRAIFSSPRCTHDPSHPGHVRGGRLVAGRDSILHHAAQMQPPAPGEGRAGAGAGVRLRLRQRAEGCGVKGEGWGCQGGGTLANPNPNPNPNDASCGGEGQRAEGCGVTGEEEERAHQCLLRNLSVKRPRWP